MPRRIESPSAARGPPAKRRSSAAVTTPPGWQLRPLREPVRHDAGVDRKALRALCLGFPGSNETFPFGPRTSVFKVEGKIFALAPLGATQLTVSLKGEPLLAEQLREAHAAIAAGYHLNKRHWNTVDLDGSVPGDVLAEWIEDSYDLALSGLTRAQRAALGI